MWTPTHVIVTGKTFYKKLKFIFYFQLKSKLCFQVLKARNLLEKGKGGNDAYCMIGMGKEKFLTSVKTKSLSPVWDEQAEL